MRDIVERAREAQGHRSLERYFGLPSEDVAMLVGKAQKTADRNGPLGHITP